LFFLVFRFLQIALLTEPETAFLKPQFLWLNILGTVLCLLPTFYTAAEDFYAFRCPKQVGKTGILGAVICLASGILIVIPSITFAFSGGLLLTGAIGFLRFLLPLLGCSGCFILAAYELFGFKLAKPIFLLLLGSLLYEFIAAYSIYTAKPLRVRTVYEILALVFAILFFLNLSKANSGIKTTLNFRLVYPLGSLAATFATLATVPELLCSLFGLSATVTEPTVPTCYILGMGIIITYITIASNTFANTVKIKND
jgi:hypothetical protein